MSANNYNFDPNLFMKLSQIGDEGDANENLMRELSFEVDENELLRELEALSATDKPSTRITSKTKNISVSSPQVPAQIQTQNTLYAISKSIEDDDMGISATLTPEDENNPELLAELGSILSGEVEKPDPVAELKKEILKLKREGKIEEAKAKLMKLNQLQNPKDKINCFGPDQKTTNDAVGIPTLIAQCPTAEYSVVSQSESIPTSPKVAVSDTQVYRELFSKLQKQSAVCQTISDFYSSVNRRPDATLFIKRKQATDLELQKLRLMLKNKQAAPQFKTVNVTYEYVLSNPDIPESQLQVSIGQLKVLLPRKFKLKEDQEYKMKVSYEISGLSEQETSLTSEPFTTSGLINSKATIAMMIFINSKFNLDNIKSFIFKCNKKDLRVIKSIEYKKIRIEIYGETGFLFFKSSVLKATTQCKLDRLLKDCTVKEELDLFDVGEDGKKISLPSAKLCLVAKLRSPLTTDGFKQCTEKWTVIPSFGYSNHTLYSDLAPLAPAPISASSISSVLTGPQSNTLADHIKSFEVIEFELGLLTQNQASVMADPNLMDFQVALEALRDRIQMQVELGQISLEGIIM